MQSLNNLDCHPVVYMDDCLDDYAHGWVGAYVRDDVRAHAHGDGGREYHHEAHGHECARGVQFLYGVW